MKRLKLVSLLFVIPFSLSGCGSSPSIIDNGYVKLSRSVETYYSYGQKFAGRKRYSPSNGEQKLLVVPVVIKGYESNATSENKEKINKAFFGNSESTGFESVSSYFEKSSFSNLKISGVVTDWVDINMTPKEIYDSNNSQYVDYGTFTVINRVYDVLKANSFNFSDYDLNNDGYIDSIYMIFSCETRIAFSDVTSSDPLNPFWAITYADIPNMDNPHSHSNPIPHMYSWSSYDLMDKGKAISIDIDAHTYIHEYGHTLGLEDYYDYDNTHSPLGCFDMQDYNVGDHNAYSKYAFGWTTPYLVTGNSEITITPSSFSGESIIVRNPKTPFSNSAFDEYLMLELLTPNGLWTHDSNYPYPNVSQKTFQLPGVRMIHVDARCNSSKGIVSTFNDVPSVYQMCSNTPSKSYVRVSGNKAKYDLVNIIPANNLTGYQTSGTYVANDNALFKTGQIFTSGDYEFYFFNGKFHNGIDFPYRITFKEVNMNKAVIEFELI